MPRVCRIQVGSQFREQFTVLLLHDAEWTRVISRVPEMGTRLSEQPGLLRTRTQRPLAKHLAFPF